MTTQARYSYIFGTALPRTSFAEPVFICEIFSRLSEIPGCYGAWSFVNMDGLVFTAQIESIIETVST